MRILSMVGIVLAIFSGNVIGNQLANQTKNASYNVTELKYRLDSLCTLNATLSPLVELVDKLEQVLTGNESALTNQRSIICLLIQYRKARAELTIQLGNRTLTQVQDSIMQLTSGTVSQVQHSIQKALEVSLTNGTDSTEPKVDELASDVREKGLLPSVAECNKQDYQLSRVIHFEDNLEGYLKQNCSARFWKAMKDLGKKILNAIKMVVDYLSPYEILLIVLLLLIVVKMAVDYYRKSA